MPIYLMSSNSLLTTETDILILLLFACLAAIAFKRIEFPYTIGLVVVGVVLSILGRNIEALEAVNSFGLSEELILFIFVPPLIFESALNMDTRLLLRNLSPVLVLAVPGLLLSTAIVGIVLAWLTPLSLGQALLFGSLISATDPVAVIALFKELGAPKQLVILVEGESLFNDATAIVTFNIVYSTIAAGTIGLGTVEQGAISFLTSFFGGIGAGLVFGYLMRCLMNLAEDDSLVLATITTITAYSAFLLAEKVLSVSGVMAVVSAGLVIGWYKSNRLQPQIRESMGGFWEYAAFLANSLIFLLVGITASNLRLFEQLGQTQSLLVTLGITIATVLVARAVVIFSLVPLVNLFRSAKISFPYQLVSYWGGLRGAVCLALALSIDRSFPNRDLIIILTLGIALFTMLVPGTTIGKLIQKLQLNRPSKSDRLGRVLALFIAKESALEKFNQIKTNDYLFPDVVEKFTQKYQQEISQVKQSAIDLQTELNLSQDEARQVVWLNALAIERQTYNRLDDEGFISQSVSNRLTLMMNLKMDAVQAGQIPPKLPPVESWDIRLYSLLIKLFSGNTWTDKVRADLTAAQYEYLTFIAYSHQQVSMQLKSLVANRGTFKTLVDDCAYYYEEVGKEVLDRAFAVVQDSNSSAIAIQTKILSRIGQVVQHETAERLADSGAISQAVAVEIDRD